MGDKERYPDSYISRDLKPWEKRNIGQLERVYLSSLLNFEEDFEKMTFCDCCGSPLRFTLNQMTGEIVQMPCDRCHVMLPMDENEKEKYISWLRMLKDKN